MYNVYYRDLLSVNFFNDFLVIPSKKVNFWCSMLYDIMYFVRKQFKKTNLKCISMNIIHNIKL